MGEVLNGIFREQALKDAGQPPDFGNGNLPTPEQSWANYAEARAEHHKREVQELLPKYAHGLQLQVSLLVEWSVNAALAKVGK